MREPIGAQARAQTLMLLRSPTQLLFLLPAPGVALLTIVTPYRRFL
ncbi:MAG: hypothetical protein ABI746_08670 [Dermatophilaceae bacterium]